MKKSLLLMVSLFAMGLANNANAQETKKNWHGIDEITISQDIDVDDAKTIYLINENNLTYKSDKPNPKQDEVEANFPSMVKEAIEKEFDDAKVEILKAGAAVPDDGILIWFGITEIGWGSKAVRVLTVPGAGGMSAIFKVKVTNGKGEVCNAEHRRYQSTALTSAKGHKVVNRFQEAFTRDLVTILKNL